MRAVWTTVEPTGLGDTAWVTGRSGRRHFVSWREETCDCTDYLIHRHLCRHLLAMGLRMGEPAILDRLKLLIPDPDRSHRRRKVAA